jgi:endoglucanase
MRFPCTAGIWRKSTLVFFVAILLILIPTACASASMPISHQSSDSCRSKHQVGSLSTLHGGLVDASGCKVVLTGVNWFGFEEASFAPHGLHVRNYRDMLKQMAQLGFNTIRLPYTNQLFDPASKPTGINYQLNPDLKGLQGLALMDRIIRGAGRFGLKIILDRHDPTADQRPPLWYNDQTPQSRWQQDWVMLARHYRTNETIIGADLANEPHGPATWGDGNPNTDWHMAAEKVGNAILAVNPHWLIIVEGIEQYHGDAYWWGGNLEGAAKYPVRLSRPNKLVYSAHDYGPDLYAESWFKVPKPSVLTRTLPVLWQKYWAFLLKIRTAPVILGEFGGRATGQDAQGVWNRTLVSFMHKHNMSYTYWAWNADSEDTGGILRNNWIIINQHQLCSLPGPSIQSTVICKPPALHSKSHPGIQSHT